MDKETFINIIKEYKNLIYKVCHSYCPNPSDHKDMEQEIVIQLWMSMKRYNGSVQLSTWIYRIALNTAISFYHKENKRQKIHADAPPFLFSDEYKPEVDEHIASLYQFIAQLGELDKALMLLYLDDTKYKDIALILGISETNVATKINRIKTKLKLYFEQKID